MKTFLWILLAVLTLGYLLPTAVAGVRDHRNTGAIFLLNFLLGWTVIGWIGALVWAVTSPAAAPAVVVNVQAAPGTAPTVSTAAPAEFCPRCGTRREANAPTCRNCGAALS